ncbi:WXG100 family type VII secretion target [Nocardia paucivorans]|uniref:WXG100 family type VII secretion target n=1 Tax=Nocardia paucivorans TaxID=114259 RepID=UPI0002F77DA1|nr:WXG100 family type VII secretion target [Nocardia paucivorans]
MSTIKVDPEILRASRPAVAQAADKVLSVLNAAKSAIEAEGECWGGDEIGTKFAEKYKPGAEEGMKGIDLLSRAITAIATGIDEVATDFENQDQQNAAALGNAVQ